MSEILIRSLVVVPVATLLALGLPRGPSAITRALLGGLIALAALSSNAGSWQIWVIAGCTAAAAAVPIGDRDRPWLPVGATLVALGIAILVTDAGIALDAVRSVARDRRVIVIAAGGLGCVFLGGAFIGSLLQPFAARISDRESELSGIENAGRVIGWIERALLYALVLTGAPDAAAIVIAAKSIARFPSFQKEEFAEYYLIGSLLSLSIAFGTALAVRAIAGI